jgi:hypothetical protein
VQSFFVTGACSTALKRVQWCGGLLALKIVETEASVEQPAKPQKKGRKKRLNGLCLAEMKMHACMHASLLACYASLERGGRALIALGMLEAK